MMTVRDLIQKLQMLPDQTHEVWIMDMPNKGDAQYEIQDCDEWDGCAVLVFDSEDANPCESSQEA